VEQLRTDVFDDWAEMMLRFENDVVATVHVDMFQQPSHYAMTIWGENGRAEWDYHRGRLDWIDRDGHAVTETVSDDFERNEMFVREMAHFLDSAAHGRPTMIPLADGVAVLEIAKKAYDDASRMSNVD
jgi:predicted dehydrogenase